MKPTLLSFAALAVLALALPDVKAQTTTSGSDSTSSSGSTSSSSSGSRSGASTTSGASSNSQQQRTNQRVNSTTNNSIPITLNTGGTGSGGGGAGTNGTNATDPAGLNGANGTSGGGSTTGPPGGAPFYSQSDVTIRTTPTVYAPPVSGGNPCTLAVSGGVSVIGWGAAAGGTFVDEDCANRQKIAMIHNAGYAGAAKELMCNDKATYFAFRSSGQPCQPRAAFDGAPTMAQQPAPPSVITPPPQQQMVTKDRTNLPRCSRTVTDNCWGG
jgi:hypothetical protein